MVVCGGGALCFVYGYVLYMLVGGCCGKVVYDGVGGVVGVIVSYY